MALKEELSRHPGLKGGKAPKETKIRPLPRIIIGGGLTTGVLGLAGCGPSSTEIKPTPIPETEAQPTNLVFTLAKENQNDPDFQKLNQANTSFFQEFKNRNPQNPWQLGETVALGVGNIDYALTTVVGPNGEPILGVISHLDKDGKPQSGFAINFFTNIPSDDGERAFVGIYPLKPEIYQSLLEGQTVAVDPTKDTQGPIFGFVLDKGKKWRDFSTEMTQATTEEQRQRVFSSYVDKIYLQKPDSKIHLFSLSKLPQPQQVQLVSYALATATPANIELTPTPKPSPTPQPSPTPEPTPTPIPQINVGEIQLPDPRITNPELFDLKKKEAPIPQFVNALKNAGIELSPEQIAQGITYVSTKEDGTPLVDKDGNPFVVAVYNLDPSLFPEQYRSLAGPVPLMIAEREENGWKWRKIELDIFLAKSGIKNTGALMDAGDKYPNILKEFNTQIIPPYDIPLGINNENQQKLYNQEEREIKWRLSLGITNNLIGAIITNINPQFHNLPKDKKIETIQQHLERFNRYRIPNTIGLTILYEAHEKGYTNEEIRMMLQTARKIYPNMKLAYNDTDNHYSNGMWTSYTINLIRRFEEYIDVVGVQMHLAQWPNQINKLPTPQDISSTLRSYGKEIWVTEFDINTAYLPGNQQEKKLMQANIAYNHIKGILDSGVVTVFSIWGLTDNESWYNNFGKPEFKNAEALPFDKSGMPKLYYYYILKAVLDTLQ